MFPFENNFHKYHEISRNDAEARQSLIGSYGFVFPTPFNYLPPSLQKVDNLAAAFVSGVCPETLSPIGSGQMMDVTFIVRHDINDIPNTGNLSAHCILEAGGKYYMSPPCKNLDPIRHHFSGPIPLNIKIKTL